MAIHPKDKKADNPRIQCSVCGEWKRLFAKSDNPVHGHKQLFFGGCGATEGDHTAGDKMDVCEECCLKHCKGKFRP